jgi:hypothetical protein
VERTEEEYVKVLQSLDAHSTEYVDRLKDEPRVGTIIVRTQVRGRGVAWAWRGVAWRGVAWHDVAWRCGEWPDQGDNVKQGDHLIPRREGIAT